ncbi:hypothetical protein GF336_01655 [Candidatus Woesearchaeota archaeon]|nr:hypothetical protein [Candidatus Woesearchaeota archaeon]
MPAKKTPKQEFKDKFKEDFFARCWTWPPRPHQKGFPVFAILLLIIGVIWLLKDLGIIMIDIPWWPVIIITLALWMIIKNYEG